jgi:Zn-finger nucleic acid-binding protein
MTLNGIPAGYAFFPNPGAAYPVMPGRTEAQVVPGTGTGVEGVKPDGIKTDKAIGSYECQTCKNRRYQDGSNDPGVSFKAPTKLTPGQAATAVYSHEREHYTREEAKAESEGREVVSNSIRIFTDVCPECGRTYVSGGETTTVTRKKQERAPFAKDFFERTVGKNLNGRAAQTEA